MFDDAIAKYLYSANATGGYVNPMSGTTNRRVCFGLMGLPDCQPECGSNLPANTFPNCGNKCKIVSGSEPLTECIIE
jgi:hypothetical protein